MTQIININNKVIHQLEQGIGVNWHDGYDEKTYPALSDKKHWGFIFDNMSCLNISWLRYCIPGQFIWDKNGKIDFNSVHFKRLELVQKWAEKHDADIMLDFFTVPLFLQFNMKNRPYAWDNPSSNNYLLAPRDLKEYVCTYIIPTVKYLVTQKKMNRIKYFNPINEPLYGNVFATPPGLNRFEYYIKLYEQMHESFMATDELKHIILVGPNVYSLLVNPLLEFFAVGKDIDPFIKAYDFHNYHSRFDYMLPNNNSTTMTMAETIDRHVKPLLEYTHKRRKSFFITEMGSFYYGGVLGDKAGPSTHDGFMTDAEFIVRAMNAGVDGFLRWTFLNPGNLDGVWQFINTADGSYTYQPNTYYGYLTLMKHIGKKAKVLESSVSPVTFPYQYVYAVSVVNRNNKNVILLINDNPSEPVTIQIKPFWKSGVFNKYVTDRIKKHSVEKKVIIGKDKEFTDKLTPMSVTVYTNETK
jgi:hypothetical protein